MVVFKYIGRFIFYGTLASLITVPIAYDVGKKQGHLECAKAISKLEEAIENNNNQNGLLKHLLNYIPKNDLNIKNFENQNNKQDKIYSF